jgi:hypothetical protein
VKKIREYSKSTLCRELCSLIVQSKESFLNSLSKQEAVSARRHLSYMQRWGLVMDDFTNKDMEEALYIASQLLAKALSG